MGNTKIFIDPGILSGVAGRRVKKIQNDNTAVASYEAYTPQDIFEDGTRALNRLIRIAQSDTGQSYIMANFLVSLYNTNKFGFSMREFRGVDENIFEDCILVIRLDSMRKFGIHEYIDDGEEIFETLASDFRYPKLVY